MSQSPIDSAQTVENGAYTSAWMALNRLLEEGNSWSGHERHCAFLNTGGQRFANVSAVSGLDFLDDGRAVAALDWDGDGDLDFWVTNRTAPTLRFLRNDLATGHHHIAVKLTGTTGCRDAIGARVEVKLAGGEPRRIVKSVRAGSGFLSQSSKWLHFGLGDRDHIKSLTVTWTNGDRDVFQELEIDRRYQIIQGSGHAKPWKSPRRISRASFDSTALAEEPIDANARVVLFRQRLPELPIRDYLDLNGRATTIDESRNGPLLVLLWASWCAPCIDEINEVARRSQELRRHGLDVLALNVDGLSDSHDVGGGADVRELLKQSGFDFNAGLATAADLTALEDLQYGIIGQRRSLPVPASLLIDRENRVAVYYRGTVTIDRLMQDLELLDADLETRRSAAATGPGRWSQQFAAHQLDELTIGALANAVLSSPRSLAAAILLVVALICVILHSRRRSKSIRLQSNQ